MSFIRSHILVCTGTGCSSSSSLKVIEEFEKQLVAQGMDKEAKVVRTGCFGLCALGPIVTIYPEGACYTHVTVDDVEEIVSEHIVKGRIVKRLLNKNTGDDARVYIMRQEIAESENSGGDSTKILRLFDSVMGSPQASADMAILYATYMNLKRMPQQGIERVLERVLEMAPDNAAARLQLVAYAWQGDKLDRVISLCSAARNYNPEEMAFYYYEGMAHYRKDDNDSALNAFQRGISAIGSQSDPDIVSDFYAVMGDLLYEKGRPAEAYAAYDSCLQWKADNIGCMNNYAYYLSINGDSLEKAERMSYMTVKAEPKNATYLDTYAWILFMQERYAEAKIYIDQAVQNDGDSSAVILEHAGDIHAKAGDTDGAVKLWRRAAAKDPGNKLLARKIRQRKYIKE